MYQVFREVVVLSGLSSQLLHEFSTYSQNKRCLAFSLPDLISFVVFGGECNLYTHDTFSPPYLTSSLSTDTDLYM